ncbi:MAG: M48 family metallopeptidase [Culturomica sp.]|jgi:predicted metal-dependent hydrolase|nr:M48 family metallopeptidase [Culturomica sp.]
MEQIDLKGVGTVSIRRGAHIRHLSIRMSPGRGVWVNVPYGVSGRQVENFLAEKKEWIVRNSARISRYEEEAGMDVSVGSDIKTKLHTVKIRETENPEAAYKMEGEEITLFIPAGLSAERVEKSIRNFLAEIYRLECRQLLPGRVRDLAKQYGFTYRKLSFRNNRSNWGSCSFNNNIQLNVQLMKLPDELIDYVILHELCHTLEKNHSEKFWALMGTVSPRYAALRNALKSYHTQL